MTRTHSVFRMGLCVTALLAAGCGRDRPTPTFQPAKPKAATGAPAPKPATSAFAAPAPAVGDDPLATPDQLAASTDGSTVPGDAPTAAGDDPMAAEGVMPTAHSHWLRGGIFNAVVTVTLNSVPLGEFRAPVDRDITMKLRHGVNTVTVAYRPQMASSSAHLDVLESEHHPPIGPLASFRSPRTSIGKVPQPITQTLTFVAD